MALIRICESNRFVVDYDPDRGMYRLSTFKDNHFEDEYWFDAYREAEVEEMYLVYGHIDYYGDVDTWVEAIFDNREQAIAFAEYLNLTEENENWYYFAGNGSWSLNKIDYIEELKKLKEDA